MKENKALQITSEQVRKELFYKFQNTNRELINLFKLVEYRNTESSKNSDFFYQLKKYSKTELEVRSLTISNSVKEIHKKYPEYDIDTLNQFKKDEIKEQLKKLQDEPNLDFKSKIFLKSSNMIIDLFSEEDIDFSAVTIGYSKFFEREVNLSIVQLIRKELGVRMPDYYEKYCEVRGNYIVRNNYFKVDFNMQNKSRGTYKPPGLGQSLICFRIKEDRLNSYISKSSELITKGKQLNDIRNKSAHPELINIENVKRIQEIIIDIYVNGILTEMLETKKMLKNN